MFKWIQGRQNTGYYKMPIWVSKYFKFDVYLLKFEEGVAVPWHKDPVALGRHFRLNVYLNKIEGGKLLLRGPSILNNRLFHLFRPDIVEHAMTKIESGTLYMLSVGKVW